MPDGHGVFKQASGRVEHEGEFRAGQRVALEDRQQVLPAEEKEGEGARARASSDSAEGAAADDDEGGAAGGEGGDDDDHIEL